MNIKVFLISITLTALSFPALAGQEVIVVCDPNCHEVVVIKPDPSDVYQGTTIIVT